MHRNRTSVLRIRLAVVKLIDVDRTASKQPISILGALSTGFDTVTRQLWLIALPAGLELLLWLIPRLKAPRLWPLLALQIPEGLDAQAGSLARQFSSAIQESIESFNWFAWLRPPLFGVPGLTTGFEPVVSSPEPAGEWQVTDPAMLAVVSGVVLVVGIGLGGLYWSLVARQARDGRIDWMAAWGRWPMVWLRLVGLAGLFVGILLMTWLPGILLGLLFGSNLDLGGALSFVVTLSLLMWTLFYLAFSIHGIVLYNQSVIDAARTSVWLGRTHFWPVFGMLAAFVAIDLGMHQIWRLAPTGSWLWVAAILGNSFVAAGLSVATMVFYMDRVPIPGSALMPRRS